jgi:hypothetical protein
MRAFLDGVELKEIVSVNVSGGVAVVRRYARDGAGNLILNPDKPDELLIEELTGSHFILKSDKP